MKTPLTLLFLFVAALTFGQTPTERPRTEFTIDLSESSLTLKPGETKQVTVLLNRSKYYAKEKATLGFLSSLPKGITVTYEPKEGNFDSSVATIVAAPDATVGAYQLVLSGMLSTKKKGTILKLTVSNEQLAGK
jgi:hypothetical protein